MVNGHAKGSEFERKICKDLSEWWTGGKRTDVFWRTAGSGAMAKTRSKTGGAAFGQYGDIQAIDPIGQPLIDVCTLELKKGYNRTTIHDVLDATSKAKEQEFETFTRQASTDAQNAGSPFWMLITKRDRRLEMVTIPWGFYTLLRLKFKGLLGSSGTARLSDGRVFIMQLWEFLIRVCPSDILEIRDASQTDEK